jgi:hypothetical protein
VCRNFCRAPKILGLVLLGYMCRDLSCKNACCHHISIIVTSKYAGVLRLTKQYIHYRMRRDHRHARMRYPFSKISCITKHRWPSTTRMPALRKHIPISMVQHVHMRGLVGRIFGGCVRLYGAGARGMCVWMKLD